MNFFSLHVRSVDSRRKGEILSHSTTNFFYLIRNENELVLIV